MYKNEQLGERRYWMCGRSRNEPQSAGLTRQPWVSELWTAER